MLGRLLERYDKATAFGAIHSRLRDWDKGSHPGWALATWLQDFREQVLLFTRDFHRPVDEQCRRARRQGAQAPPGRLGYWHTLATPGRRCLIRSYLTSAANHGKNVLDAIRSAIEGEPWMPPLPAT